MTDLTYTQDGMFTRFYPETKAGEIAWNEMANMLGGVATVMNFDKNNVIRQLRAKGYKVTKAIPVNKNINDILDELEV